MLERLTVRNFQALRSLSIEFDKEVTVIVGPNDLGKTAVLRALEWICTNQPGGEEFKTTGKKKVSARLDVDGRRVTRRRAPGRNQYLLDGKDFRSFGARVPDEIAKVLNVSDINFQSQHETAFWLSSSAGDVSKRLNAIINLGAIDESLARAAAEARTAKTKLEVSHQRLQTAKRERKALLWAEEFKKDADHLEELQRRAQDKREECERLAFLLKEAGKAAKKARTRGQLAQEGSALLASVGEALKVRRRVADLEIVLQTIQEAQEELCEAQNNVTELSARLRKSLNGRCPMCGQKTSSLCCVPTST